MAIAQRRPAELLGVSTPRIAPPIPASSQVDDYESAAKDLGIDLYPWQKIAARYITALGKDRWQYREVCVVVARQNGKTELLMPRVLQGLRMGESILHTAQNRDIPRKTFLKLAGLIGGHPDLDYVIRKANGQEEITAPGGGRYKLVAPNSSMRGDSADLVLIDEVREQKDLDLMDAMLPTVTARPRSQIVYLSNAGDSTSVVLNDLKRRADTNEPALAYLEWSAMPERPIDDRDGWAEANPALGLGQLTMGTLEYFYNNRPGPSFETEHLCRWEKSMRPKIVSENAWLACRGTTEQPSAPAIGLNMDPTGRRASVVKAWVQTDGRVAIEELMEARGETDMIDTQRLGEDVEKLRRAEGAKRVAFASWTDKDIARYITVAQALDTKEFAAASEMFARYVLAGRVVWERAGNITDDLPWTARKPHDSGAWMAVPATPERSVTAVLAAIRAVWLASAPKPPAPRIG